MTPPTLRSLSSVNHSFLLGRLGLHFFNQRCKKCLTNSWTLLHLFFGLKLSSHRLVQSESDLASTVCHRQDLLMGR